jgi:hypothetical protein
MSKITQDALAMIQFGESIFFFARHKSRPKVFLKMHV